MVKGLLALPDTSSLKLSWWTSICLTLAVWRQRDASKPNSLRRGLSCCPPWTGTSIATPPRSAGPTPSCSKVFPCRKFFLSSGTEPRQVLCRQIVNSPGKRRAFLRTNGLPVVLVDIDLLGVDGLEATRRITAELPRTKVIGLGATPTSQWCLEA